MDEESLYAAVAHLPLTAVHFFSSAGSTNDLALEWLERGAPDLALVAADCQTAGRGRLQRQWITQPGSALAFSLIIHPLAGELDHLSLFAPLAGLAVCRALEDLELLPEIKWPNDVLLERRKVCGILVETVWDGAQPRGTVVGIGVNVAPSSVPPEAQVMFPAGCVEHVLGKAVNRAALLAAILKWFFQERPTLGAPSFIQAWQQRLAFRGEMVRVEPPGQAAVSGTLQGVDTQGNLVLRTLEDVDVIIAAGDVARLRPLV